MGKQLKELIVKVLIKLDLATQKWNDCYCYCTTEFTHREIQVFLYVCQCNVSFIGWVNNYVSITFNLVLCKYIYIYKLELK